MQFRLHVDLVGALLSQIYIWHFSLFWHIWFSFWWLLFTKMVIYCYIWIREVHLRHVRVTKMICLCLNLVYVIELLCGVCYGNCPCILVRIIVVVTVLVFSLSKQVHQQFVVNCVKVLNFLNIFVSQIDCLNGQVEVKLEVWGCRRSCHSCCTCRFGLFIFDCIWKENQTFRSFSHLDTLWSTPLL